MILLENYRYNNKNIISAEKYLKNAIDDIKKGYSKSGNNKKFITNENIKKVNEYLTNEFKANVNIYINPISPLGAVGPHTCPGTFKFLKRNYDGTLRTENTNIHIFIDTNSIIDAELTSKELMAIILHEIGHNIDGSNVMGIIGGILRTINSSGVSFFTDELVHSTYGGMNKLIDILPNVVKQVFHKINSIGNELNYLFKGLTITAIPQLIQSILSLNFLFGYYGERFGDSVATVYGYGPHLISAIEKMGGRDIVKKKDMLFVKKMINSNPITGLAYDVNEALLSGLFVFLAPHPSNLNRAKNSLSRLKSERKQANLPKEIINDLDTQIEMLENMISEIEKIDVSEYRIISSATKKMLSGFGDGRNRTLLDAIYNAENYEFQ